MTHETLVADDDVARLRDRGAEELAIQFTAAESRLRKMIELRIHAIRRRVDASDVVQETFLEANRRLGEYLDNPVLPPLIWFRQLTRQVLANLYRTHIGTQARDLGREADVRLGAMDMVDSDSMAVDISASMASPYSEAALEEERAELRRLLSQLTPIDREVLCMKQIEGHSFTEISGELSISVSAAKRVYYRLLGQVKEMRSFLNRQSIA